MIDRLLDVLIGCLIYLIRIVIRMMKARGSSTWSVQKGTVTGSSCDAAPYGGPVAEITYTYTHEGEYFSGMNREPFILNGSAQEYVARFRAGGDVIVRVNPVEPEASIVREDDQTVGILNQQNNKSLTSPRRPKPPAELRSAWTGEAPVPTLSKQKPPAFR